MNNPYNWIDDEDEITIPMWRWHQLTTTPPELIKLRRELKVERRWGFIGRYATVAAAAVFLCEIGRQWW